MFWLLKVRVVSLQYTEGLAQAYVCIQTIVTVELWQPNMLLLRSFLLWAHRTVFFALRMMFFLLFLVPLLPFSVVFLFLMLLLSCCSVWLGTAALAC